MVKNRLMCYFVAARVSSLEKDRSKKKRSLNNGMSAAVIWHGLLSRNTEWNINVMREQGFIRDLNFQMVCLN